MCGTGEGKSSSHGLLEGIHLGGMKECKDNQQTKMRTEVGE